MHFDHIMNSMEGRHLVFAYLAVALIHGTYAAFVARAWFRTKPSH